MGALTPAARSNPSRAPAIAALLGPRTPSWSSDWSGDDMVDACRAAGVSALLYHVVGRQPGFVTWPRQVREALAGDAHAAAATELLAREELVRVLSALSAAGLAPILLKGAPLAYSIYAAPSLRERADTDLLVPAGQVNPTLEALKALGYTLPPFSAGERWISQRPLVRRDQFGAEYWLDLHWAVSTAKVFADALTYDELAESRTAIPALGPHAFGLEPVHALLLACMHPVMHHRNAVRLTWIYDLHLLAGRLDDAAWRRFVLLAAEKQMREVCAHSLDLAREWLATPIPAWVTSSLAMRDGRPEPSSSYLASNRGWLDEMASEVKARSWLDRLRLLQVVGFPPASYMLASYGLERSLAAWPVLPLLYVHRGLRGVWRVVRGKK